MGVVNIVLCVALGRVLSAEQDFVRAKGPAAGRMADDGVRHCLLLGGMFVVPDEAVLCDFSCLGVLDPLVMAYV